jgi:hypothetical protein
MKRALLTGAALLMAVSSVAFAQTAQVPPGQSPSGMPSSPPGAGNVGAMNRADNARAGLQADASSMFANVPVQSDLGSKVIGLSVHNSQNTDLGTIKDIAFDADGVKAYIVAVGGFMGVGNHYVAVRPSAITITYDATNDKWQASMNTDVDQLKAAPEYKYSSNG